MRKLLLVSLLVFAISEANALMITRTVISGELWENPSNPNSSPKVGDQTMVMCVTIDAEAEHLLTSREILKDMFSNTILRVSITLRTSIGEDTKHSDDGDIWFSRNAWDSQGHEVALDYSAGAFFGYFNISGDVGLLDDCFVEGGNYPYSFQRNSESAFRIPDSISTLSCILSGCLVLIGLRGASFSVANRICRRRR